MYGAHLQQNCAPFEIQLCLCILHDVVWKEYKIKEWSLNWPIWWEHTTKGLLKLPSVFILLLERTCGFYRQLIVRILSHLPSVPTALYNYTPCIFSAVSVENFNYLNQIWRCILNLQSPNRPVIDHSLQVRSLYLLVCTLAGIIRRRENALLRKEKRWM